MRLPLLLLLSLAACGVDPPGGFDDSGAVGGAGADGDGAGGSTGDTSQDEAWCAVEKITAASCLICHGASQAQGELDLETDLRAALVGVPSATYADRTLVVAGDAEASFLVAKLVGTQAEDEGDEMPPGAPLAQERIDRVREWIDAGAVEVDCADPGTTGDTTQFHPDGYDAPDVHGMDAKFAVMDCASCHGATLDGGDAGVGCDDCHSSGWRTTCTYCHGGGDNTTGAPPEDIDDAPVDARFTVHSWHVEEHNHGAFSCSQCHLEPTDVLSKGHLWDETAGLAEVRLSGGLSAKGSWDSGSMSCSNLYCHGDGQGDSGSVAVEDGPLTCHSCHADTTSGTSGWQSMSGKHEKHLNDGLECSDCHADTATGSDAISTAANHVNGSVEWAPGDTTLYVDGDGSCTGFCHFKGHWFESW